MGIIERALNWATSKKLENPENPITGAAIRGDNLKTGQDVTKLVDEDSAMGVPVYYGAIRLLSETFASLQVQVGRTDSEGNTILIPDHPVNYLLSVEPKIGGNAIHSAFVFKQTAMYNMIAHGNMLARIKYDNDARPKELDLYKDGEFDIIVNRARRKVVYKTELLKRSLRPWEVLHVPMVTDQGDGIKGVGVLEYAKDTLGLAIALQRYMGQFFVGGAQISGVVEHPKRFSPAALTNFLSTWKTRFHGLWNAGSTAVLEEGAQYKQTGVGPKDADIGNIKKHVNEDLARFLGVPQHMVQILDRSTNNNIEQQAIEFVVYFFRSHLKRIENEFNRKLFTREELNNGYWVRFNVDSLLRADSQSRANLYRTLYGIGVLSSNEIRAIEKMNRVDGLDTYYRPLNMVDATDPNAGSEAQGATGNTLNNESDGQQQEN